MCGENHGAFLVLRDNAHDDVPHETPRHGVHPGRRLVQENDLSKRKEGKGREAQTRQPTGQVREEKKAASHHQTQKRRGEERRQNKPTTANKSEAFGTLAVAETAAANKQRSNKIPPVTM